MGSAARAICVVGVVLCAMCQPIFAATAQARACAEIVSPVRICGSLDYECSRFGTRLSATRPEMICSPDTVAKFDIVGGKDRVCSIILPQRLDINDSTGRKVAVCSFSSIMGESKTDSPVVGVVIKAQIHSSGPKMSPCSAAFDVIVAYD